MEPTIKCGKHSAKCANLAESTFEDVNLSRASFDDVNLSGAKFHNINLSDLTITAAQIGGTTLRHIGLPPGSEGKQRPIRIEEADLNAAIVSECNLSNVRIERCKTDGMTIDGVSVADLLAAYRKNPSHTS